MLFAYGTLRQGEYNHHILGAAPRLGWHRTAARYTLLNLGDYPGVVTRGHTAIVGELYALDGALLARLDRLEEYPRVYDRARVSTRFGLAWMYVYRRSAPGAAVIASGDWCRRQRT